MSVCARTPVSILLPIAAVMSGWAQIPPANPPDILVTTTFVTPIAYTEILRRLDGYYDEQVGQPGAMAFPAVGPNRHFEVWHEMWAQFDSPEDHTRVTLKRLSDPASARIAKTYMLDVAGRLGADLPLIFREEPGLRTVESGICSSRKDLAASLADRPAIRSLASWRHSGLFVSFEPLTRIALSAAHLRGERQLRVTTVDLPAAKSLLAKLQQAAAASGICAAYSEEVELDTEIHEAAENRNDTTVNGTGPPSLYHPQLDLKYIEARLRGDPAMQKRIAAAHGSYDVRFRVDRAYRAVKVTWGEAAGPELGQASVPNVRKGPLVTVRVHLETLKPGGYRVRLSGEGTPGETVPIDERIFKYDGKTFEEPQDLGK